MDHRPFLELIQRIVAGETDLAVRQLKATPQLATTASPVGATRERAADFYFPSITRYLYLGDTAIHMAAAAYCRPIAEFLSANGADCRARNRLGAEPLHFAADGGRRNPDAQAEMIRYLISVGADPNAVDKTGVTPLHRAVRTRSLAAVRALLDAGADPWKPNKKGSTPMQLAMTSTGASGSGSKPAKEDQALIISLLHERGASCR